MQNNTQGAPVPLAQDKEVQSNNQSQASNVNTQSQKQNIQNQQSQKSTQQAAAPNVQPKRDPTVLDPPEKTKGRKRGLMCACCCSIIALIILAIGGLGVYAYYTDTEIPIISNIVDKITELIADPKTEASKATEKAASTLIGNLMPFMMKDESLASSFTENAISEEYINEFIEDYESVDSLKYSIDFEITPLTEVSEYDSFAMTLDGAMDFTEVGGEKMETSFIIDTDYEDTDMDIEGDCRIIGEDAYVRFTSLSSMLDIYLGSFSEKWIYIEPSDVEDVDEMFGGAEEEDENFAYKTEEDEITEEDIDKLMEFVTDDVVVKNAEILDNEDVEGNNCECVKMHWNQEEMKDLLIRYNEIYEEEYTEEEINEIVEDLENMELVVCLGKDSEKVHKIRVYIEETDVTYDIVIELWDYNVDVEIEAPTEYHTLDELFGDFTYDVNDYSYDENIDYESLLEEYGY